MAMSPNSETDDSEKEKATFSQDPERGRIPISIAKQPAKRRTKTGCLTCRKRRIKCGEEKPFCKNCIKSKRDCAGYVQPLVYKQHNQGGHTVSRDIAQGHSFGGHENFQFNEAIDPGLNHGQEHPTYYNPFAPFPQHGAGSGTHVPISASHTQTYPMSTAESPYATTTPLSFDSHHRRHSVHHQPTQHFAYGGAQYDYPLHRQGTGWSGRQHSFNSSESTIPQYPEISPASSMASPFDSYPPASASYFASDAANIHDNNPRQYSAHGFVQASPYSAAIPTLSDPRVSLACSNDDLDDADDSYDIEMEDHYRAPVPSQRTEQGLADMLDRHNAGVAESSKTSIREQASAAVQAAYYPMSISPLCDERNEKVFCHFVEVTGRCMTIFERTPINTLLVPARTLWSFTLPATAMAHPALAHAMLAMGGLHIAKLRGTSEDPPLKHFTLALRRVGKLLGLPKRRHEITTLATVLLLGFYEVMSADHSRWNLHLEGAKKLIIEHDYAGLTRLTRRMRYRAKQRIIQYSQRSDVAEVDILKVAGVPQSLLDDDEWEVDQVLISKITGLDVNYDTQVQPNYPRDYAQAELTEKDVLDYKTKLDLRWWYCKQDCFQSMVSGDPLLMPYEQWRYCPPRGRIGLWEMPYATFDHLLLLIGRLANFGGKDRQRKQRVVASQGGQWKPPPGFVPGGQSPAGSNDRTAKETHPLLPSETKDRVQNGKMNPQSETLKSPQAPSANEGRVRQSKQPSQAPSFQGAPPIYGMMPPPPGPIKMHSSFDAMRNTLNEAPVPLPQLRAKRDSMDKLTLEEQTAEALAEHASIVEAFDLFAASLGPQFEPIIGGSQTSPFGPPWRYRSPAIAIIWAHYKVGRILLHRLHPHMPPAAMIAAGVAAHKTREYAQDVGKICAGLYQSTPGRPSDALDPSYAGALIESTFPLLFAGVQYQDISQRGWAISKLHDIARMTGWQTSAAVAAACEIAWERQGLAGKGPPYQRSLDRNNKDARVNGTSRLADGGHSRVEALDPASEHESQFVSHDRNLIGKHGSTRVHWALGLLSVEQDIEKLELTDK